MKKFSIVIFIIFISSLFLTCCTNNKSEEKHPANLKKITGKVV